MKKQKLTNAEKHRVLVNLAFGTLQDVVLQDWHEGYYRRIGVSKTEAKRWMFEMYAYCRARPTRDETTHAVVSRQM
jgi:hypothetical protein